MALDKQLLRTGDFLDKVCKAMKINPETVQRVIIDADIQHPPVRVYVQHIGTTELLSLDLVDVLQGAEIRPTT